MPGVDLWIDSTVPLGAGLSSSAAIECAVAVALNEVWRLGLEPARAGPGRAARRERGGRRARPGSWTSPHRCSAERDHAVFLDCRSLDSELVELGFAAAGLELLVIDTGVKHAHATGGYGERRASCERARSCWGVESLRDLSASTTSSGRAQAG